MTAMGLPLANAFVRVRAETSSVQGEVGQGFSRAFDGLKAHFGGLGKAAGVAIAGGAAVGLAGLAAVLHTGIGEFEDYQAGLSQLQAGLKSTGGVAGISSQQMEDLATSIQGYSGQTDDSIVKTESLLLTFTNIRDQAGKNNDVFTQTTKIAADMAARMGGDASGAAIQLGKALNDPVKGITALTRVGVSFSDQQKKTIADMVAHNNTLGAQKVILAELNKEFGGSAKAFGETLPGQIARAKRSFEDMSQSIVTAIMPIVLPAMHAIGSAMGAIGPIVENVAKQIPNLFGAFKDGDAQGAGEVLDNIFGNTGRLVPLFRTLSGAGMQLAHTIVHDILPAARQMISDAWERLQPILVKLAALFTDRVVPALRSLGRYVRDEVLPILRSLAQFIAEKIAPVVIHLASVALAGLRSALDTVRKAIEEHRPQLEELGHVMERVAAFVIKTLAPVLSVTLKVAFTVLGTFISQTIGIVSGMVDMLHTLQRTTGNVVSTMIGAFRGLLNVWLTVAGGILDGAAHAFGWVPGLGGKLKAANAAFEDMKRGILATLNDAAAKADGWGERLGNQFAAGIRVTSPQVASAAHELGMTVDRYLKQASPAKAGPLSQGGGTYGWGAAATELYAKGLRSKLAQIHGAAAEMGGAIGAPAGIGGADGSPSYAGGPGSRTFSPSYHLTVAARDTISVRDEFHRMELLSGARYDG